MLANTEIMLKYLKYPIKIKNNGNKKEISVLGKQFLNSENNYTVPGDPSSAAFIIVLAVISKNSCVELKNVLLAFILCSL